MVKNQSETEKQTIVTYLIRADTREMPDDK